MCHTVLGTDSHVLDTCGDVSSERRKSHVKFRSEFLFFATENIGRSHGDQCALESRDMQEYRQGDAAVFHVSLTKRRTTVVGPRCEILRVAWAKSCYDDQSCTEILARRETEVNMLVRYFDLQSMCGARGDLPNGKAHSGTSRSSEFNLVHRKGLERHV